MLRPRLAALAVTSVLLAAACGTTDSGVVARPLTTTTAAPTTTTLPTTVPDTSTETTRAPGTTAPPAPLMWRDCGSGLECATLVVPLDHADPSAGTIELFVKRRPAERSDQRIGSLLVNPGGPGIGGTLLVDQAPFAFSQDLLDRFDIVSWDPRGTGRSAPVDCFDDLDRYFGIDPTPDTPTEQALVEERAEEWGRLCLARHPHLLPTLSTTNTARDMDRLRAALGEDRISYFGFSYGSTLGGVYATLYPEHVRAMVLDGSSNPNAPYEQEAIDTARAFDRTLAEAFDDCAGDRRCPFASGGDPGAAFDDLLAGLDQAPLEVGGGRPPVGQGVAYYGIVSTLYDESYWPSLMEALAAAQEGDGEPLLRLYDDYLQRNPDGTWSDTFEALVAINCLDAPGPRTVAEADALTAEMAAAAPRMGEWAGSGYTCTFWPVGPDPLPTVTGAGAGPIVVVGTTGDPITPLESSRGMANALEGGVLVTVEAERHTGYGVNRCIVRTVDRYLIELQVPPEGLVCS